jgi:hypothetical protein
MAAEAATQASINLAQTTNPDKISNMLLSTLSLNSRLAWVAASAAMTEERAERDD